MRARALRATCQRLVELADEQRQALAADDQAGWEGRAAERERLYDRLLALLSTKTWPQELPLDELKAVLAADQALEVALSARLAEAAAGLSALKRGREALYGYASAAHYQPSRFVDRSL